MMLLTNKPVVLIDFWGETSSYKSRLGVRSIVERRCRIIDVQYNEYTNLPDVDFKKLSKALTFDWDESVDSSEIRELLLGEK